MGNPIRVAIDVDLVLVNTAKGKHGWFGWLLDNYRHFWAETWRDDAANNNIAYNLSKYFHQPKNSDTEPFDFWEQSDLYDKLEPIEGAVKGVLDLYQAGFEIYFISQCNYGHTESKVNFLQRHFGVHMAEEDFHFVATKSKGVARDFEFCIDDRVDMLNKYSDNTVKIRYHTVCVQDEEPKSFQYIAYNWEQVIDIIVESEVLLRE